MNNQDINSQDINMSYLIPELPRQIPPLGYAIQNIAMAIGAMATSTASFFFTLCIVLPLSFMRMFMPSSMLTHLGPNHQMNKRKVVLVIGGPRGIGARIIQQYANDPETVIIAACKQMDDAKRIVEDVGTCKATVHPAELDIGGSKKVLADVIQDLDSQYGPITHMYEVTGPSAYLKDSATGSGLNTMSDMISAHVTGTFVVVATTFELMRKRSYGKICIVGPNGMISYMSTKAFINTFADSLRVLAAPCGIEVIVAQPGFLDGTLTKQMRSRGIMMPQGSYDSANTMAWKIKRAAESGGVGVVSWPLRHGVAMHSLKALNPICEEVARWGAMQMGMKKAGMKTVD
ncbi:hypothetical protein CPB84DRAFT_1790713 [Gymnopilus junonius]|uniref:NAD(P)-binding protein n=1 Tax=Gymnopilus junonius TaxID=109634 RepID=A0A9P5TJ82_GYMJU|nr:hypothetical protein CPB84DRAFT_1790713 [Gymnopilus junonius]